MKVFSFVMYFERAPVKTGIDGEKLAQRLKTGHLRRFSLSIVGLNLMQ
jgi:hypothetical protein